MKPGRRRRLLKIAAGGVAALVVTWVVWAYAVIQTPRIDTAGPVDAVLVLGGLAGPQRAELALQLVQRGLTDTVVLSMPVGSQDALARRTCANPPAGVDVVCFRPDPSTTRGEARELAKLTAERGWTKVAVVTSTYHVSRSRMIVDRCFHGSVTMLASAESISPVTWAYQYLYQSIGHVKALVLAGC